MAGFFWGKVFMIYLGKNFENGFFKGSIIPDLIKWRRIFSKLFPQESGRKRRNNLPWAVGTGGNGGATLSMSL